MDREYTLTVVQQPVRARMCGFGDKDRRPISPPVLAQLRAVDRKTGQEIPVDDIDTTFLILAADLRSSDGTSDANLIYPPHATPPPRTYSAYSASSQHPTNDDSRECSSASPPFEYPSPADSQTSPLGTPRATLEALPEEEEATLAVAASPPPAGSLSSASAPTPAAPKRPRQDEPPASLAFPLRDDESASPAKRARSTSSASSSASALPPPPPAPSAGGFIPYARPRRAPASPLPSSPPPAAAASSAASTAVDDAPAPVPNLIGTLHTNAHKLKGVDGRRGVYFVLPDLSVRTEGAFRVRLRVLSVGFAKKFEGMLDPTPLSQCFAKQGVRIPTRKVAKARVGKGAAGAGAEKMKQEEA
ncbi:hypothetical protein JCM10450v2_000787 [Rhodotorula kratochvilovae]